MRAAQSDTSRNTCKVFITVCKGTNQNTNSRFVECHKFFYMPRRQTSKFRYENMSTINIAVF
jgi:hypothetical protein